MFITFINNFMIFINLFNFLFRNKLNVKEAIDYISEALHKQQFKIVGLKQEYYHLLIIL
jgi:hypothetical protein